MALSDFLQDVLKAVVVSQRLLLQPQQEAAYLLVSWGIEL